MSTLVRNASTCRHCGQTLHYKPDPDPTDLETCQIWVGVEPDGTLGSACYGESADTYPCYACSGKGEDEDGYECDSCGGSCVTADHEPTT